MEKGPLDVLAVKARTGLEAGEVTLVQRRVKRTLDDIRHLLEGATHPMRPAALSALKKLEGLYRTAISDNARAATVATWDAIAQTTAVIVDSGIEGLSGWGPPPGVNMVVDGDLLVPGLVFGNIFVGPQPPRGWELNEELLHANLSFPPPHQYLGFYTYLRNEFQADAIVHVGRHSTHEFLPGRRAGLGADDFSRLVMGDLPNPYIYIVDGVGEGIQAKRRGHGLIVDHLTPSLRTTPLYDDLLTLRQLVESYEAAAGIKGHAQSRALEEVRATISRLKLKDALVSSMQPELTARGISFDDVDGDLLIHEVGHYLTTLQERFMPDGLHIFGQPWKPTAVDRMVASMANTPSETGQTDDADTDNELATWRQALVTSPDKEAESLLGALTGRFTTPGPGNDPIRTPEVLPTGRSFHALDASVLPTRLGYALGVELSTRARKDTPGSPRAPRRSSCGRQTPFGTRGP